MMYGSINEIQNQKAKNKIENTIETEKQIINNNSSIQNTKIKIRLKN